MTSVATSEGGVSVPSQKAFDLDGGVLAPSDSGLESPQHEEETNSPQSERHTEELAAFSENRVAIVDAEGLRAMGELAGALSYLWIPLEAPGPQHRGRLGLYIEDAIEQQLEKRGALPPGIQASTGLDASLSDQLYRARFLEMRGIALGIPTLEGITNLGRSMDAEDSAVLRWWIAAAADRPVQLVISRENTKLRVYPSPVLFESLFEVAPLPVTPLPPSPSMAESSEAMDLSDLPPAVEETNVLGTKVASFDDGRGTDSLIEEDEYYDYVDDYGEELEAVDLPDLDRALGLAPVMGEHSGESQHEAPRGEPERTRALKTEGESSQLPLDYESPAPAQVHTQNDGERLAREPRIFSPAAPSDTEPVCALDARDEAGASDGEAADFDDVDAPEMTAPVHEKASSVRGEPHRGALTQEDLADLDEDEFLRTLEEDSARAPIVEGGEEAAAHEGPIAQQDRVALAPLPRKKITRNPFIKMADPDEAVDTGEEEERDVELARAEDDRAEVQTESGVGEDPAEVKAEADPQPAPVRSGEPDPNDPFNQLAAREWKSWVTNLEAARGPKPLSVIERMFVTDYTRLREAVRRNVADSSANEILDEWQQSFSKSYSEAFDALRVRGKRPTMVLDIVEMAGRLGRLQGAKRVQLLLVDGLRFDLGLMVQDRMRQIADAALTERLLLWSALPSVTQYQLELLGRGPDGLKDVEVSDEPPALVARGASARVPRRVRTGSVELYKLDVVEDCLREVAGPVLERMDGIADETAAAITEHLNKQPPRTMVVTFGDHGFALDPKKAGTTEEVRQGGSSPEEVLVPAFAWLTGAVH